LKREKESEKFVKKGILKTRICRLLGLPVEERSSRKTKEIPEIKKNLGRSNFGF